MSKLLQHPTFTGSALEGQWINTLHNTHDLFCGCNKPLQHLLTIYNKKGNAPKPEEEIKNILCLITGDKDSTTLEEDGFEEGELEKLFEEDGDDSHTEEETG